MLPCDVEVLFDTHLHFILSFSKNSIALPQHSLQTVCMWRPSVTVLGGDNTGVLYWSQEEERAR